MDLKEGAAAPERREYAYQPDSSVAELAAIQTMLAVAASEMTEPNLAAWIAENSAKA